MPAALVPLAIDELPVFFVAAACASEETLVRGALELRVKESDRLATMAGGLAVLGEGSEAGAAASGGGISGGRPGSGGFLRGP